MKEVINMADIKKKSLEAQHKELVGRIEKTKIRISRDRSLLTRLEQEQKDLTEKIHFKNYAKLNSILEDRGLALDAVGLEKIADFIAEEQLKTLKPSDSKIENNMMRG